MRRCERSWRHVSIVDRLLKCTNCSDPDRTGLRGLQPVWCIDDKANSWPLCLLSLLFFLIDAENFDRSMGRTPCTLFCVSVTVNMLLRITHNISLTADDFLIAFIVSRLLPGSAESCHCDCTLVFIHASHVQEYRNAGDYCVASSVSV